MGAKAALYVPSSVLVSCRDNSKDQMLTPYDSIGLLGVEKATTERSRGKMGTDRSSSSGVANLWTSKC